MWCFNSIKKWYKTAGISKIFCKRIIRKRSFWGDENNAKAILSLIYRRSLKEIAIRLMPAGFCAWEEQGCPSFLNPRREEGVTMRLEFYFRWRGDNDSSRRQLGISVFDLLPVILREWIERLKFALELLRYSALRYPIMLVIWDAATWLTVVI